MIDSFALHDSWDEHMEARAQAHEEAEFEYLSRHRPEPEPPFEWTAWDDMQERILNGEYDDVIDDAEQPEWTTCERCHKRIEYVGVSNTLFDFATPGGGYVCVDDEAHGICYPHEPL